MEPKIVSMPAFTVAGLAYRGVTDGQKIMALWEQFGQRMHEMQNVIEPQISYGVMANFDEATEEYDYIAASQVASGSTTPEGFTVLTIPACEWAIFTTTIPEMPQTYPYIYSTWLPQSGYQHGPAPEFERYNETFDPANPASPVDIFVPVVREFVKA